MDLKHKLVGAGAALLAVAGLGTATAVAQTSGPSTPPTRVSPQATVTAPEPAHAPDTDNVQQGDQNAPDAPETGDKADSAEKTQSADGNETGEVADGSGGHQDPPGNIDNRQSGQN
jgi:hypothetical protein